MTQTGLILGAAFGLALCASVAVAAPPLRADHPLLGAWQVVTGDNGCAETYRFDRSGTSLVTSAEEVAESTFTLSDQPNARGFYKWVDTLVKDNGKKDCSGHVTKLPHVSTTYLVLNPAGDRFLMCLDDEGKRCLREPFVKVQGGDI